MKEKDIIESIKGLKRAEPSPFLFTRIEAKLTQEVASGYSLYWFPRLAFCLGIFLIIVNVTIISNFSEGLAVTQAAEVTTEAPSDTLYYSSIVQNLNFYENE